jgi:hypothetical protein
MSRSTSACNPSRGGSQTRAPKTNQDTAGEGRSLTLSPITTTPERGVYAASSFERPQPNRLLIPAQTLKGLKGRAPRALRGGAPLLAALDSNFDIAHFPLQRFNASTLHVPRPRFPLPALRLPRYSRRHVRAKSHP